MSDTVGTSAAKGRVAPHESLFAWLVARLGDPRARFAQAFETEIAERRLFLWLPAAAGLGVVLALEADRDPSLWFAGAGFLVSGGLAAILRGHRAACAAAVGIAAVFAGFLSAGWRSARVAAPVLDHIRIATLEGRIEQMDFRRAGARFILRCDKMEGLTADARPKRVRLTIRRAPPFEAGTYVRVKARLVPPAQASLPGGYDFARDAWFAELGAVGNVLGRMDAIEAPTSPDIFAAAAMALDRGRNALARRVDQIIGGDAGAIGAAMVTGKRDLLSEDAKEVIREAGIFHIITIAGVQMTLVAAIFFVGLRRLLALSPMLALTYPIKKWAAAVAIGGAIFYDLATGSRVGTERALFMTTIMLGAVLVDRQALSMRNLAFAALVVIAIEPEALLGASFQLSFAAVAALIAVYEARIAAFAQTREEQYAGAARPVARKPWRPGWEAFKDRLRHGPGAVLFATFCATSATASFMAYNFHELSPYVLIGNPLTLIIIELFAVPGALVGALLYPLGLDAFVWHYVGASVSFILWAARLIGSAPGATLHLPAFAPWAIAFLALAVLSSVIWRTALLRASAIPLALIGLYGAAAGPSFDLAVAPGGTEAALRGADGSLSILGHRPGAFAAEQWLRADADARRARSAEAGHCDKQGCVGALADGRPVALVLDKAAFEEDCLRAAVIISPLSAPVGCAAPLVLDHMKLRETGAVTAQATKEGGWVLRTARAADEDRPWSRPPKRGWGRAALKVPESEPTEPD